MYLTRTLQNYIGKASDQFPVLLLTGARQVGKTTILRQLADKDRTYVTLDDPLVLSLAKEDPALFMQRFGTPVLIDEIQYAPQLLPYIKMVVDEVGKPGLFWLTGSQQFQLMRGVSESLAGRVGIVQLYGFSLREIEGKGQEVEPFLPQADSIQTKVQNRATIDLKSLFRRIWRGSYPMVSISPEIDRDLFYSSYVQTYLQRDVRDLAKVGDEMAFVKFIRAAAARTGQLLNYSDLSRDADISPNTAKSWVSILQTTGIIQLIEPYFSNVTKRMVKAPKLYFLDSGLCTYLTEWSSPETLEAGAMSGAIFETWVVSEILKSWNHNGKMISFYYYRDKDKKEIDLLIVQDGKVYPIEIKKTASPTNQSIRHFSVLKKLTLPIGPGGLVCLATDSLPLAENIHSIPGAAL